MGLETLRPEQNLQSPYGLQGSAEIFHRCTYKFNLHKQLLFKHVLHTHQMPKSFRSGHP